MDTTALAVADIWTPARIDLLKRSVVPKGIPDDEFALFLEQSRRSGLDPLLKQAFCVARKSNVGTKDHPKWVERYEFQPSEAGMLARAERFPDYLGVQAEAVFAEDEIKMDAGKGEVTHRFNPTQRGGRIVGAWARVVRREKVAVLVWVDFNSVVQNTPMWGRMPALMCTKCARVSAIRKAYPEAFGGLYTPEEMPAEETPPERTGPDINQLLASEPPATLFATPKALGAPTPAAPPPPPATGQVVARQDTSARDARATATIAFNVPQGAPKGTLLSELSDKDLARALEEADHKLLTAPEGAKWKKALERNRKEIRAEWQARDKAGDVAAALEGLTP